jgi:hypothetical protein
MDKPLIPQTKKTMPESLKLLSPKGARGSPGTGGAPSSPTHGTSGHNHMGTSSGLEPNEFSEASPPIKILRVNLAYILKLTRDAPLF